MSNTTCTARLYNGTGIFVLCIACLGLAQAADNVHGARDLKLSLEVQDVVATGMPVSLTLRLRNVGTAPLEIPEPQLGYFPSTLRVSVAFEDKGDVVARRARRWNQPYPDGVLAPVRLEPGAECVGTFYILLSEEQELLFSKPGQYRIGASLRLGEADLKTENVDRVCATNALLLPELLRKANTRGFKGGENDKNESVLLELEDLLFSKVPYRLGDNCDFAGLMGFLQEYSLKNKHEGIERETLAYAIGKLAYFSLRMEVPEEKARGLANGVLAEHPMYKQAITNLEAAFRSQQPWLQSSSSLFLGILNRVARRNSDALLWYTTALQLNENTPRVERIRDAVQEIRKEQNDEK